MTHHPEDPAPRAAFAKRTLVGYLKLLVEEAGLTWQPNNAAELEMAIDDILDAGWHPDKLDPAVVYVALDWEDLALLRQALHEFEPLDARPAEALEARLGEAHQSLPNPLDAHLPTP